MVRSNSAGNNQIYTAIINGKEMTTNLSLSGAHMEGDGEGVGVESREVGRVSIRAEGRHHSVPSTPSYSLSTYEKDSRASSLKDSEFNFSAQNNQSHFNDGRSRDKDRDGGGERAAGGGVGQTHGMNWPAVAPAQVSGEFTQRHVQEERIAVHTGAYEGMRGGNRIGIVGERRAVEGVVGVGEEGDTSSGLTSSPGVTTDSEGCSERQIDSRDGDHEVEEGGEGGRERDGGDGGEESEERETTNLISHNVKDNTTINTNSITAAKQVENLSSSSKGTNKKNKQQQKKKAQKK